MNKHETASEALSRAQAGQSLANFPAIFAGFLEKGIPETEIMPRENVLTFQAWRAKGRTVMKGEHGVRVVTYIPMTKTTKDDDGQEQTEEFRRPRAATVFHVSQTKPLD